jgi:hypothetical protein
MPQSGRNIRILNFDDSLTSQKNLIAKYNSPPYTCEIIDFKKEAPYLRYWANRKLLSLLAQRLGNPKDGVITLYGSGDFHHISIALIECLRRPISVLVFDYHPDWDGLPPQFSCGSWVNAIVDNDNVKKVILLGPSSHDLSAKGLFTASFRGLKANKLEIYPYQRKPSRLFFRNLKNIDCLKVSHSPFVSKIEWDNLAQKQLDIFLPKVLSKLATDDVYISIDKDCLSADYAVTNWEEGPIALTWLLKALELIKLKKNIVAVDITGDYSPIMLKSRIKKFISSLDHPYKNISLQDMETITRLNEDTNLQILNVFS